MGSPFYNDKSLYAAYICAIIQSIMDIGVCGLIGYEGALALYKENRAFLDARFPAFWIRGFLELPEQQQLKKPKKTDHSCIIETGKGGLYAALWEMCESLCCGCEVDIKSIPIAQEVVEICECFDKDPYEIDSSGVWIITGEDLTAEPVTIIGKITDSKDRIILMGFDEKKKERTKRFLTPPARQEKDLVNGVRK